MAEKKRYWYPPREDFSLDLNAIEEAIGPKTAGVLINSPNNPTGKIYTEQEIKALGELLIRKGAEIGRHHRVDLG